ncbi:MAG: CD225/dispanin family protein [Mycobacterium sp.]|nr:MAG: CD225/dispanin family protein [Mycobacterium sp.]
MSYPSDPYGANPGWQGQPPPSYGGPPAYGSGPEPDNYLVWAILSTVLCCLPAGIVSIVYSTKVSGLWAQGRYGEAQEASRNAKKWAIISAIVGAVVIVVSIILYVVLIAAAVSIDNHIQTTYTTYSGY